MSNQESDSITAKSLQSLLELLQRTTSLDENEATTVIYFTVATHGLPKLRLFPVLCIQGGYGSGKTTLLEILKDLAYRTNIVDGTETTKAVMREPTIQPW